jgi:hypothetical protein
MEWEELFGGTLWSVRRGRKPLEWKKQRNSMKRRKQWNSIKREELFGETLWSVTERAS